MEQTKAMEYGSRKASPDVLKPRNIYNMLKLDAESRHIPDDGDRVDLRNVVWLEQLEAAVDQRRFYWTYAAVQMKTGWKSERWMQDIAKTSEVCLCTEP